MNATDAAVAIGAIVAWLLVSGRAERANVSSAFALVAAGVVLANGPLALIHVELHAHSVRLLAEIALAVVLFGDASRVDLRQLRHDVGVPVRLLAIGLPLTIAVGIATAVLVVPGTGVWVAATIAAIVAPTDAALGAPILVDRRVPRRIRRALNVESGLNDGLVTPVVLFAIAAVAGEEGLRPVASLLDAVVELAVGVGAGVAVGVVGGRLATASRTQGWSTSGTRAFAALSLPVAAYAGAAVFSGNGFIAAFVAGTAYASSAPWLAEEETDLALTESIADLLGFAVWFIVGLSATSFLERLGWRELLFAVLALTVLRMGPVWLCLLGTGLRPRSVAFIGWFGPRGLASVVFALLALEQLEGDQRLDTVLTVIATTVVLSVVLHGVTAEPLARAYGAWVDREKPPAEMQQTVEPRSRARLFTRAGPAGR